MEAYGFLTLVYKFNFLYKLEATEFLLFAPTDIWDDRFNVTLIYESHSRGTVKKIEQQVSGILWGVHRCTIMYSWYKALDFLLISLWSQGKKIIQKQKQL